MSNNEKKVGLPKPPLFTSDYIAMAEILQFAMERFGQLILALMYYTTDGTMPDNLPSDISMMFAIYQRKIDAAREKYKDKCIINAENGSKGGRPRKKTTSPIVEEPQSHDSETAKNSKAKPKVKMPPTREQFNQLIEMEQAEGNISAECKLIAVKRAAGCGGGGLTPPASPLPFYRYLEGCKYDPRKKKTAPGVTSTKSGKVEKV